MAAHPQLAKSKIKHLRSVAKRAIATHQCAGANCVYCLAQRDAVRFAVGDSVRECKPVVGKTKRLGTVQRIEPRKGTPWLLVRFTNPRGEEEFREGTATDFRRIGAVKVVDPKLRVPHDLSVYQVFRCIHGIAYLRVENTKHGARFVVNKGFSVELIELDGGTCRELGFEAVVGSSIWESAKRLLHPLNDQVTISMRAKAHLDSILNNKELENMATAKTKATRTAKFATVNAPAAKGSKASKKAAKGPKAAAKAKAAGNGAGGGARLDNKVITVKVKENPLREGTFCHAQVAALMASNGKTVADAQKKLDASKLNPNDRRIEIAWAVKKGYVTIKDAATK